MRVDTEQEAFLVKVLSNDQLVRSLAGKQFLWLVCLDSVDTETTAGMTALVAFDIFIFFSELVWKAKLSMGKLLYLYIRYASLGLAIAGFYGTLYIDPRNFPGFDGKVTQLVKAVAPYGDNPPLRKKLFICLGSAVILIFALSIKLIFSYESIEYPFLGIVPAQEYLVHLIKFFRLWSEGNRRLAMVMVRDWSEGNRKLAMVMVRDSLAFTVVLTILAIPQFLTPLLVPTNTAIVITGLNFVIIAIIGVTYCRMILNIRSCLGQQDISLGTFTVSMGIHTRDSISEINFDRGGDGSESL
ncbi:hypothetical protein A7U60_g3028 [Sanghuangporus baumii]|uniref:DUF6533 domain-containing protein n=1 Tax=Sanghuangporus baumii TaxID=108892 RepID=A0A9Q5I162_SANBA|nr:hypothetical protein A7U60_g3028 [Sanghuangporus baumii]